MAIAHLMGARSIRAGGSNECGVEKEIHMLLILLIVILVLTFDGGCCYYGYRRWGTGGGLGIFGLVLIILLLLYVFGGMHRMPY